MTHESRQECETFRIMKEPFGTLGYVPLQWMRRFNEQAKRNHCEQDIDRLNERGGLSAQEAMAVVSGQSWQNRRWKSEEPAWANLRLIVEAENAGWNCEKKPDPKQHAEPQQSGRDNERQVPEVWQ